MLLRTRLVGLFGLLLFVSAPGCSGTCGDGVPDAGEACDDGNDTNGDGCDDNCAESSCGNGAIAPGGNGTGTLPEECDEGPLNSNAPNALCRADCSLPKCGDSIIDDQQGEQCDDGNQEDDDGCSSSCQEESCGDSIANNGNEQCDDGNTTSGDGCNGNCRQELCGDNIVNNNPDLQNPNETCDDGNNAPDDGCDLCVREFCGDGVENFDLTLNRLDQCDDGNNVDGDGCDNNCTTTGCPNGVQTPGEICDDGNQINGDACDSNCTIPDCGNGVEAGLEECDDGNNVDGDGCDSDCLLEGCGDGIQQAIEECDDGNSVAGDGCNQICDIEQGHFFESEQNDQSSVADGPLLTDVIIHGEIGVVADHDFFSFTINTISDLKAETFDAGVNLITCNGVDTTLRFFAPNGSTQLAFDDEDGINACSKLDPATDLAMRRLTPGTYFFRVEDQGDNQLIPKYQLRITITDACGDNSAGPFEACDDGNTTSGDGCDAVCVDEFCGDVIVNDTSEECDDGNASNTDACIACQGAFCGDNFVRAGVEQCDDGDLVSGDGCDANCTPSGCGNGILLPGEICYLSLQQIFSNSLAVAVGRFNGDNIDDIAFSDTTINVGFLIGDGAGGFTSSGSRPVGQNPVAMKVGNFNADNFADLVVVSTDTDSVSILLGDGAGSFGPATTFAVGDAPIAVAVGRFNADTIDDLAVVNNPPALGLPGTSNVSILTSNGTGGFVTQTPLVVSSPADVAVSDFNNDSAQDLVVADAGSNSTSIFFGNNNGTFQAPATFLVRIGAAQSRVAIGHFDADAFEDLAFTNGGGDSAVSILLGNADGSFRAATNFEAGSNNGFTNPIVVGRFDNDLFDDIAVVKSAGGINILRGNGAGSFSAPITISSGTRARVLAKGTFDRDAIDDLALANTVNSGNAGGIILADGTTCGNGFEEAPLEPCDDGNTVNGDGCSSTCQLEGTSAPFFSEYIEGASGTNKAVEILNPLNAAFDMSANACSVRLYTNGAAAPNQTVNLTGSIAPGDVFVLCNSLGDPAILAACDLQNNFVMNFNGDDGVELFCNGATLDFIGQKGVDPGTEFGVAPNSTANQTLRRKCGITDGDTDFTDAFNPATEWTSLGGNFFSDLGIPSCSP